MLQIERIKHLLGSSTPIFNDEIDSSFNEITSLVEQEAYDQASSLIEKRFESGLFDIRLIMYFLYPVFTTGGLVSLKEIFPLLSQLMVTHWETLNPIKKRDFHAQKSLNWLFLSLHRALEFVERQRKKGDRDQWNRYLKEIDQETLDEILALATPLNELFVQKWGHSPISEKFLLVRTRIKDLGEIAIKEREQKSLVSQPVATSLPQEEKRQEGAQIGGLLASEPMELLLRKLSAFEGLALKGEYRKAAIIADDVAHTLESFNPLLFFPKLFISHLSLVAKHVSPLESEREEGESPLRRVLEKLYQADLDAFIGWKGVD